MFTDIHQHIISGIDDGASGFEETIKMFKEAKANGISNIIATPHAAPGLEPFDLMKFFENFNAARSWLKENNFPIRLYRGAELFYTDATVRMLNEGRIPTLAGTKYVLIEFSPDAPFETLSSAAVKLGGAGYEPIFAHVERYRSLRKIQNMRILREELQVLMQVNARTILKPLNIFEKIWLRRVLKNGLVDIVASDAHNTDTRKNVLYESWKALSEAFGKEEADRLYNKNPMRILEKRAVKM